MYQKTLYPKTKQVLEKLKPTPFLSNFYLAGGTGLALQLGHRKSIDLDFFSYNYPKKEVLLGNLSFLKPKIIQEALNTLDLTIDGVKVSFLEYKYPLIESLLNFEGVQIASLIDIACMKISAISSRGTKKDFFDFYFILKKYTLKKILAAFEKKFVSVKFQKLHILKSLVYFRDAEKDPDPDLIEKTSWKMVKDSITKIVKSYSREETSALFSTRQFRLPPQQEISPQKSRR